MTPLERALARATGQRSAIRIVLGALMFLPLAFLGLASARAALEPDTVGPGFLAPGVAGLVALGGAALAAAGIRRRGARGTRVGRCVLDSPDEVFGVRSFVRHVNAYGMPLRTVHVVAISTVRGDELELHLAPDEVQPVLDALRVRVGDAAFPPSESMEPPRGVVAEPPSREPVGLVDRTDEEFGLLLLLPGDAAITWNFRAPSGEAHRTYSGTLSGKPVDVRVCTRLAPVATLEEALRLSTPSDDHRVEEKAVLEDGTFFVSTRIPGYLAVANHYLGSRSVACASHQLELAPLKRLCLSAKVAVPGP